MEKFSIVRKLKFEMQYCTSFKTSILKDSEYEFA